MQFLQYANGPGSEFEAASMGQPFVLSTVMMLPMLLGNGETRRAKAW